MRHPTVIQSKEQPIEMQELQRITLPSVPGKAFARVLLDEMKSVIHAKRIRAQSVFTPAITRRSSSYTFPEL